MRALLKRTLKSLLATSIERIGKVWYLLSQSERKSAIVMLGLMLLSTAFEVLGIGLVIPVVSLLMQEGYMTKFPVVQPIIGIMGNPSHQNLVAITMLGLVGIYFIKSLFLSYYLWRQLRFAFGIQTSLSQRLFARYMCQPYVFHLRNNSAELLRNATVEVGMFITNAINPLIFIAGETLVATGLCSMLFLVEPAGAVIVILIAGFLGSLFYFFSRGQISRWAKQRQLHEGQRIRHLQQGLGGIKDAKLLGREQEFLKQYKSHNLKLAKVSQLQQTLIGLPRLWLEVLTVIGLAALVITMVLMNRETTAILSTAGLFAVAAFRLIPSVNKILRSAQSLRFGHPVIEVLFKELAAVQPKGVVPEKAYSKSPFKDKLEVEGVNYTYPGNTQWALSNISLSISRGESIGIIGTSGAGKSTLVDVILGLLEPSSGRVIVDGGDIRKNLRHWMGQLGYVPQTIFLTDDTLRHNIAFGLPEEQIDEDCVWKAIKLAHLDDFILALPDGLETKVGERGVRLSGGQRQRIGIARALYHNPAVLVLDEATSSLDAETEADVMRAVRALGGKKTIIIIAHRLSTVKYCDRLYQLNRGIIEKEGTPDILFA